MSRSIALQPRHHCRIDPLRIGIIAHLKYPIAEPFAGGLEMHTHLLASKLRARGHDVTVFAATKSSGSIGVEPICTQTALDVFGNDEADDVAFFKEHHAYLTLMNQLRGSQFDIIHNNSLHYLPIVMADALPMPMITTLHTPPFKWLASGVRIAGGKNLALVAVSDAIRTEWADVALAQDVILNGVDLGSFRFHPAAAAQPYLVWYGRIVPEKGLHLAIDAARLAGMTLRFAGPMSDASYFETEIRPRLGDDTIYAGHLSHDELSDLVGGARAFLCSPCWEEPFGLVVAEALACGVPVAAFARGAIPTILTSASGALAAPNDAQSLADAARIAMTLRRADCRRRAETFCDAEVMVDNYEAVYRRALGTTVPNDVVSLTDANVFLPEAG
jgi:glycosyltransferase involved in cell wall biosynthesis